jgi:Putative beta-barrel porin-2, OmpL-like. bbp2
MKNILAAILVIKALVVQAQPDSTTSPLTITGYAETYYSYDFGKPQNHSRPGFVYSHNRHNEFNLNLGCVKAAYQKENVRANLALMTGTYANANLAAEPVVLRNIFEANAGIKISKTKNLWMDAGIFASHIGFESAIGKDCWNLTRSIMADNSPYYETGAKISYTTDNGKWFISGLLLNGWQRIQRIDGNNTPALGHQLTYKPNSKITLNSSSFIGNDKPDSVRQMRYFHNFYGIFQLNKKIAVITGFDIGAEQKSKGSRERNNWYTPVVIVRLSPDAKNNMAARIEYYSDANGTLISTGTLNGFKTWGYSLNYDYAVRDNVLWRIEGRGFTGKDAIFVKDRQPSKTNFFLTTALAVSF